MKKEQCDDLLQQLIYGAFKKKFSIWVNDGSGYCMKENDVGQIFREHL